MADDVDSAEQGPRRIRFESELVSGRVLRLVLRQREREGGTLGFHLALAGVVTPGDFARFLHEVTGLPRVDPGAIDALAPDATRGFPEELLYDGGLLPLRVEGDVGVVAMCDPTAPGLIRDARLFATARVEPAILGLDLMALHYPRVCGRYWRLRPDQIDAEPDELDAEVRRTLTQAQALEGALLEASLEDEHDVVIELVHGGEREDIALSRARRTAAATLDRAGEPVLTAAERPRIAGKAPGGSRHYLDPVQEGEAVLVAQDAPRLERDAPKIIIDMEQLEEPTEDGPSASGVILDPSLFAAPAEPAEPTERRHAVPRQIKLGRLEREDESVEDALDIDIDIDIDSAEFSAVDEPSATDEATGDGGEWLALGSQLEAALDLEELDWPFDPSLDGPSAPSAAPGDAWHRGHTTRKVEVGPLSGEMHVASGAETGAGRAQWFDPRTAKASGARVSDALRNALRELAAAENHEETFLALTSVLGSVFQRSLVMRIEGDRAVVMAHDTPRTPRRWLDTGGAPAIGVTEFGALERLIGDASHCFEGRLPQAASVALDTALPGGPSLAATICPITLAGRVVLLLYGDAGPGRETHREPELWRLLVREVPRALLRLNSLRKRHYRWELKA